MFTKEYWVSSFKKLSSTTYLALIAIFIAMKTIVSIWYIPVSDNLHIAFTFLVVAIESCIIGPGAGMVSGAITDIVSFMISMVSFGGSSSLGLAPFALAIVAATLSNSIPIGFIYVLTCIGTFIGFGTSGLLSYIITSVVFFASLFILKTRIQDDCNERRKVGKNLICWD